VHKAALTSALTCASVRAARDSREGNKAKMYYNLQSVALPSTFISDSPFVWLGGPHQDLFQELLAWSFFSPGPRRSHS